MSLRLALVVAVREASRTVDIVYSHNSQRVANVQVSSSAVHSDGGEWKFPSVPKPTSEQTAGQLPQRGRQLLATVDLLDGRPIVTGFLHPLNGEMVFTEADREVSRHGPSGFYETIAPDGSYEMYHPSGSYVRIGTGAAHDDLSKIAANDWTVKSDAPAPTITVHHPRGDFTIDPDGNFSASVQGTSSMHSRGDMSLSSDGNVTATAGKAMVLKGTTIDFNP